jgi:hypothetical protein
MVASMDSKVKRGWKKIPKSNTPPVFGEGTSQTHTIKNFKKTAECREQFVSQSGWVKCKVQL